MLADPQTFMIDRCLWVGELDDGGMVVAWAVGFNSWVVDWLVYWLVCWVVCWLVGRLVGLVGLTVGLCVRLVDKASVEVNGNAILCRSKTKHYSLFLHNNSVIYLVRGLVDQSVGYFSGCSVGWLVVHLVDSIDCPSG